MALRLRNVQVDVPPDVHDDAVAWWAAALGGTPRDVGGPFTHLDGVRSPVGVHVQRQLQGPARFHLDLEADDPADRARVLEGLGASVVGVVQDGDEQAHVLRDPAGLELCVTGTGQVQHLSTATTPSELRVLAVDVPGHLREATATFWATALGGGVRQGRAHPEYSVVTGLTGPDGRPVPFLVQGLGDGEARVHVDLHVPDPPARDAEVTRLVALGASVVQRHASWVVLATPGDLLVCVVPDREEPT